MSACRTFAGVVSVMALLAAGSAAVAQDANMPSVEIVKTTVAAGLGGSGGKGTLMLKDLAPDCKYGFTVDSFGAGIAVGVEKSTATGVVTNMKKLADFPGGYSSSGGTATFIKGGGVSTLKNQRNDVGMELKSKTEGVALGVGASGMTIKLDRAIAEPPRTFVAYFGFNKDHVNADSRNMLAQVANAWKCRYVNLHLVGMTDTVGSADANMDLSRRRAEGVQAYLQRLGFRPNRITVEYIGKGDPLKATGEGVRLRSNRAVLVTVK